MRFLPFLLWAACAAPNVPASVLDTGDGWMAAPPGPDLDGDGWSAPDDCDDTNPWVHPDAEEVCDGLDNDCVGGADNNLRVRPFFPDGDGDGYGDPKPSGTIQATCPPDGFSPLPTDCNDANADIHPLIAWNHQAVHAPLRGLARESSEADRDPAYIGDGIDQDCDFVDLCHADLDGDGFGDPLRLGPDNDLNCHNGSADTSANGLDCDDSDPGASPEGTEIPGDGLDQDCDGGDTCWEDLDGDGFGTPTLVPDDDLDCTNDSTAHTAPTGGDCDDTSTLAGAVNPGAPEVCDGLDNDCDGDVDEVLSPDARTLYRDADGDGFGRIDDQIRTCGERSGYVLMAGDCDDEEPRAYPGNAELCDGIDNNCEAGVDEDDAIDVKTWYLDADGDGYGSRDVVERGCDPPDNTGPWVLAGGVFDPNDADPNLVPRGCTCSTGSRIPAPALWLLVPLLALRRRS